MISMGVFIVCFSVFWPSCTVKTNKSPVQSLADDAVSIDGTDYLPFAKPNTYKDYELIYYINDVTIDNEEVLVEYGATGVATGTYEYGLQRLSVEYVNEAKGYYLYNGTGNVTQTTAENGSMFLRYTYDPFGNVTSINAPMTVDIDDLNRINDNVNNYSIADSAYNDFYIWKCNSGRLCSIL